MQISGVSAGNGSGHSEKRELPIPLEELSSLSMKQIAMLNDRGILYVQELLAMLSNDATREPLIKYLGLSRREAAQLEDEAESLLTPEEIRSLKRPVPRYPLGAEDYRRTEIKGGGTKSQKDDENR